MRRLRLFFVILVTFTLPLSAWAGMGFKKHCVMQANGTVVAINLDCCDHEPGMKGMAKMQSCKSGQECNSIQAPSLRAIVFSSVIPTPERLFFSTQPVTFASHLLDALWRPPRLAIS